MVSIQAETPVPPPYLTLGLCLRSNEQGTRSLLERQSMSRSITRKTSVLVLSRLCSVGQTKLVHQMYRVQAFRPSPAGHDKSCARYSPSPGPPCR
ncbi:hypothetical protein PVAG01_02341 [Phlyctema vagabunda]|uniref:Uncharacterized protein n=1 Tax=Phlyctema vagabunda TaxID=108571 RepID=A0ABR4PQG6_9HELO